MIVVCVSLVWEEIRQIQRNFSHPVVAPNVNDKLVKSSHCSPLISRMYLNEAVMNDYVDFGTTCRNI